VKEFENNKGKYVNSKKTEHFYSGDVKPSISVSRTTSFPWV